MKLFLQNITFFQCCAILFIIWEIVNIVFSRAMWKNTKVIWLNRYNKFKGNLFIRVIEFAYIVFCIILLFYKWYVGLLLILLSGIGSLILFPSLRKNESFNIKIFLMFLFNSLLSILLLLIIILK